MTQQDGAEAKTFFLSGESPAPKKPKKYATKVNNWQMLMTRKKSLGMQRRNCIQNPTKPRVYWDLIFVVVHIFIWCIIFYSVDDENNLKEHAIEK